MNYNYLIFLQIFGTREEARLMEEELQKVHDKFEFMERLFEERLNQSQNAIDEEKTTNNMLRIKLHNIEEALQMEKVFRFHFFFSNFGEACLMKVNHNTK